MREIKFRQWTTGWSSGIDRMIYLGDIRDENFHLLQQGEIMRYTGIRDKNDKEIYEKDILYDPVANDFYVVTWDDSYAMFFLKNTKEDADKRDYGFVEYDTKVGNDLYIVGNVYENPELLNS